MTYSSRQDFATTMAASQANILRLNQKMPEFFSRTQKEQDQETFARYLHSAMGWKKSTVQDWA